MSLGYNSINLVGRITADLELKKTKSDSAYCRFSIAVNRGKHPTTGENMVDFFDCITWNESAENLVGEMKELGWVKRPDTKERYVSQYIEFVKDDKWIAIEWNEFVTFGNNLTVNGYVLLAIAKYLQAVKL